MNSTPNTDNNRVFAVIWQNPDTREFCRVATLTELDDDGYQFTYDTPLPPAFEPFAQFPDPEGTWTSPRLFPFFQNRVMSPRRPDLEMHLTALGMPGRYEPLEMLARSGGERGTDTIHVVPDPVDDGTGRQTMLFLVSGARHVPGAGDAIAQLERDDELRLEPEPTNEVDAQAVMLISYHGASVGYVPGYLVEYLHGHLDAGHDVRVTVEHANGPDVAWHLRLLCRLAVTVPAALGSENREVALDGPAVAGEMVADLPAMYGSLHRAVDRRDRTSRRLNGLMRPRRLQPT